MYKYNYAYLNFTQSLRYWRLESCRCQYNPISNIRTSEFCYSGDCWKSCWFYYFINQVQEVTRSIRDHINSFKNIFVQYNKSFFVAFYNTMMLTHKCIYYSINFICKRFIIINSIQVLSDILLWNFVNIKEDISNFQCGLLPCNNSWYFNFLKKCIIFFLAFLFILHKYIWFFYIFLKFKKTNHRYNFISYK